MRPHRHSITPQARMRNTKGLRRRCVRGLGGLTRSENSRGSARPSLLPRLRRDPSPNMPMPFLKDKANHVEMMARLYVEIGHRKRIVADKIAPRLYHIAH